MALQRNKCSTRSDFENELNIFSRELERPRGKIGTRDEKD